MMTPICYSLMKPYYRCTKCSATSTKNSDCPYCEVPMELAGVQPYTHVENRTDY